MLPRFPSGPQEPNHQDDQDPQSDGESNPVDLEDRLLEKTHHGYPPYRSGAMW